MQEHQAQIETALTNLPEFASGQAQITSLTRLGGLTNLVYRVDASDQKLIVRIPGEGTESYIDRKVELHNAWVAARTGISAEILWADGETGVMISRLIEPAETMTPALFKSRSGSAARAGVAMRALHTAPEPFEFRFELFAMIDDYLAMLREKNATLPEGYNEIVAAAAPVKEALANNPAALAPCHCDPLCENFLDDGDRMWIIDWEYSGMNDPMWDLGDLSVEAGFSPAQDMEMLTAYFGHIPTAAQHGRMVIYKAMCDLLWTLWGLIQHAERNPAEDFWAYATGRFERCKALMGSPGFSGHLRAISG
mgnify:CR=1 FL=1